MEIQEMKSQLLSVIIPVYNAEKYLRRCLDSVLNNTYRNLEVICVDDGSMDNSLEILRGYQKNDKRVVIIPQKNSGVSHARNTGLKFATGKYIAFIDADDWIDPNYFALMSDAAMTDNADVVCCKAVRTETEQVDLVSLNNGGGGTSRLSYSDIVNGIEEKLYVWGKLYRKEIINENQFDERLSLGEDAVFNLQVCLKKDDLVFIKIQKPLYFYFQNPESAVHRLDCSLRLETAEKGYLDKLDSFGKRKNIILEQAYRTILVVRFSIRNESGREKDHERIRKLLKVCDKNSRSLGCKKRLMYLAFSHCPVVYMMARAILKKIRGKK